MIRYTGIGSRSTPVEVCDLMRTFAIYAADRKWHLRSGGGDGADTAFEEGCSICAVGKKTIYLPWKHFNDRSGPGYINHPTVTALKMAESHPVWRMLSKGARLLHARNCHQVLGRNLKTPSDFLVCWTEGGQAVGGTATAIKLAKKHKIPVFNLGGEDYGLELDRLVEAIKRKVPKCK